MSDVSQRVSESPPGTIHLSTASLPPPSGARQAWDSVETEADALAEDEVESPRVDLQTASELVLRVASSVRTDEKLMARFLKLAGIDEFDADLFARLVTLAHAAWYAKHCQLEAESQDHTVALDALVAEGETLRKRMFKLAEYNFSDHAVEASVVEQVSMGRGARNVANALVSLADLYDRHPTVVAKDSKNYRPTDVRDARRVVESTRRLLGTAGADAHELWTGRCSRVWVLLDRAYGELQSTGRWLMRRRPAAAAERFPSLVANSRSASKPRVKALVEAPAQPASPTEGRPMSADVKKPARRRRKR